MELTLALARMVGKADYFVSLAHQVRTDPGASLARAVTGFQRMKRAHAFSVIINANSDACTEAFEKGDLERGVSNLVKLINQLPLAEAQTLRASILGECATRMAEFGTARMEYCLLAIFTLHMALTDGGNAAQDDE